MTTYLYGGQTYTIKNTITATSTSITLRSFTEPVTGENITMALMNSTVAYGTIAPKTGSSEFISFTGITQNSDGTATLTGVTRGLKRGYDYSSDASFKLPHNAGTKFILSDSPQALYAASPIAAAGGSDTQLQRNASGLFGGITGATSDGTNVTYGSGNLRATSPRITTSILDANGNTIIGFSATASANRSVSFTNSNGGTPLISTSSGTVPLQIGGAGGFITLTGDGTGTISEGLSISTPGGDNTSITTLGSNKSLRVGGSGTGSLLFTTPAGYTTGTGGTVTQGTSRTTGVTLNKACGAITLVSAAGSTTPATFTVTNSTVSATDVIYVCQKSGTDLYTLSVSRVASGAFDITFNTKSGTTTEQPVFNFVVLKAVTS